MRADMNRVLVDTYRVGGLCKHRPGRLPRDLDDLPRRMGMRKPYNMDWGRNRKEFGENLGPLFRWLDKQVGRPWNDVYSEICRGFDKRKVINAHILQHVRDAVCIHNLRIDEEGAVWERSYGWESQVYGLYVNPHSGILQKVAPGLRRRQQEERTAVKVRADYARRRVLNDRAQLHNVDGKWYFVELAPLTPLRYRTLVITMPSGAVYERQVLEPDSLYRDAMLNKVVHNTDKAELQNLYGSRCVYGKTKRQLSHQELKKYGILA